MQYTPSRDAIDLDQAPATADSRVPHVDQLAQKHAVRPDDRRITITLAQADINDDRGSSDTPPVGRPPATRVVASAGDEPYRPDNDANVLERLPVASNLDALAPLRAQVRADPQQLRPALALAQAYIELSRAQADPRYLGYAQATLAPWPDGPTGVKVLRATIAQSRHEFERALRLLDGVLVEEPGNVQARLTRATIYQVRGHLDAADADCRHLIGRTPTRVFMICHASNRSLGGELAASYKQLSTALQQPGDPEIAVSVWGLTVLGEMARRLGRDDEARKHFEAALALDASDIYLQAAYADLLLAEDDNAAVIKLLHQRERQDVLLLRLALAGKGTRDGGRWATLLADRFAAAARRGDTTHAREHARFVLDVQNDPAGALKLARANWAIQKEPADIRILLRAARAADQPAAAKSALDWIAENDFEDQRLDTLIHDLRAAQP